MAACVTMQLYYDDILEKFIDEDGFVVYNLYDYITPSMHYLFLEKRDYMLIPIRPGYFVELFPFQK